jgi:uncharacterized protein YhaN
MAKAHAAKETMRDQLGARLQSLAEQAADLEAKREVLAETIGTDPQAGALELVDYVHRVQRWQEAQTAHESAIARCDRLEEDLAAGLARVNEFLGHHDLGPATEIEGLASLLDDLSDRSTRHRAAQEHREQAQRRLEISDDKVETLVRQRMELFTRAGLDQADVAALAHLVEQRDPYLRAVREFEHQQRLVADRQTALQEQPAYAESPEVARLSAAELAQRTEEDGAQAECAVELHERLIRIEQRIEQARQEVAMEDALAALERTQQSLRDERQRALENCAGQFLLRGVLALHQERSQPAVLKCASELFSTFTHHTYRLDVTAMAGEATFRAHDTRQGRGLALSELSDGTRAQLLLAARLAFVLESERGSQLPIMLDESLTASDPERFHAIATSLLTLVREGRRQLFYLTDPRAGGEASALLSHGQSSGYSSLATRGQRSRPGFGRAD